MRTKNIWGFHLNITKIRKHILLDNMQLRGVFLNQSINGEPIVFISKIVFKNSRLRDEKIPANLLPWMVIFNKQRCEICYNMCLSKEVIFIFYHQRYNFKIFLTDLCQWSILYWIQTSPAFGENYTSVHGWRLQLLRTRNICLSYDQDI